MCNLHQHTVIYGSEGATVRGGKGSKGKLKKGSCVYGVGVTNFDSTYIHHPW